MDLLVLCLTTFCVQINSKTDFHLSTQDIACKQLATSSCEAHFNWINRCSERKKLKEKELSTLHQDPKDAHRGQLEVIQYRPNISMHEACAVGNLDVVKYILSHGLEDINCRGQQKRTPVMTAAKEGHVKVFEYLVSQGCDLSAVNVYDTNVLHYACMGGSTEIVRKLIVNEMCNIESIGFNGKTPILYAAHYGQREVFELLVENGCDLLVTNKKKENTLHLACKGGHVNIIQHILSHKFVSMESRDYLGRTPVLVAAMYGKLNVFEFLVGKGGKVNAVDYYKHNILHTACWGGFVDMVKHILSLNIVSMESKGFAGRTPVLIAAWYGKLNVFKFLIAIGGKVNAVDNYKCNILHVACWSGSFDIVQHILSLNIVSVESRGSNGRTPVLVAARYGKTKLFDFLIGKGCNKNAVSNGKNNILHEACVGGFVDMVQHILSLNIVSIESRGFTGQTPLLTAAANGKMKAFDVLVGKGSKLNAVDDNNNNILHEACVGGFVDMVQHILSLNIVSIESRGFTGQTPLLTAAANGKMKVFDVLVGKGSKLNAVDDNNNNILHVACMGNHVDMVKDILSLDIVSIDSRGIFGRTPLMLAAEFGSRDVFGFLFKKGAKIALVDNEKNNILHLACIKGHVSMVTYLLSLKAVEGMENLKNKNDRTPLQVADFQGHTALVNVLKGQEM